MTDRRVTVLYDAQCNLCAGGRRFFELLGAADGFAFVDIHDRQAMTAYPGVRQEAALGQMHLVDESGRVFGGYEAVLEGLARMPMFAPLHILLQTAPLRRVGPRVYAWIARNRYRLFGRSACSTACGVR